MSQNWRSGDERKVFAFVNFAHPNQMKDQARRSIVQSHVGRYYRNRSKPAQRRQKFNGLNASGQVAEAMHRSDSSEGIELILDDQDEGHENITYCSPHEVQRDEQFTLTDVSSVKHFQNKKELMESLVRKIQLHTQAAQGYREHSTEDQERSHARTEVLYRIANADLVGDLDQSRIDPFARYPVDRFASHVPALVDYGMHFWLFWFVLSLTFDSGAIFLVVLVPRSMLWRNQSRQQPIPYTHEKLTIGLLHIHFGYFNQHRLSAK